MRFILTCLVLLFHSLPSFSIQSNNLPPTYFKHRRRPSYDNDFMFDPMHEIDQELNDIPMNKPVKDDPDMDKNACEIINSRGFICETHHPVTLDGYILTLYRIINPFSDHNFQKKRPMLLMHGLLGSAADFVVGSGRDSPFTPPSKGFPYRPRTNNLGFELANHGFDVWLGNFRGNWYSQNHTKYTKHDRKFWQFTFDHHVDHDLPCFIGHVLFMTGESSLGYVGHSMGGGAMLALLATQPHLYTDIVKPFIALAPQSRLKGSRSTGLMSVESLGPLVDSVLISLSSPFPPSAGSSNFMWNLICQGGMRGWCQNFFAGSGGFVGFGNINSTRFPVFVSHYPQTTSSWVVAYFVQAKRNSRFMKFDYLSDEDNFRHHGQIRVPEYRMEQIRSPHVAIFWSSYDTVVTPTDIKWLTSRIRVPLLDYYEIPKHEKWTHGDYLWAMRAPSVVFGRVIKLLDAYEDNW